MATSGNFLTSASGQGGGSYFDRLIFEWWRDSWGRSGGAGYHNISYTLKSYGGSSGAWMYCYNNSMNVDGSGYSRGQTQVFGAGATTILNGGKTLWTDGAGNRSFGASAQAGIYTSAVNSSGSGSWAMDNIPMHASITNTSGSQNDEFVNPWVEFANPAGGAINVWLELPSITGSTHYAQRNSVGSRYTWTLTDAERNALRSAMSGVQSTTLRYVVYDTVGGVESWATADYTITIINGNPVFTTATYKDANSATVAITGNNQYLVQGYSTLEADIASGDKAIAQKSATMTKYNLAISSISTDVTYTTSAIAQNLGTLGINADATLNVKAIDSRNNSTTVPLTVHVLPYVAPQITATAQRINNFETSTDFHIEGVISRLTVGGTDKNTVNTTSGVRYRYKKTTDGTWGSWVNVASTTSSGNVATTNFNVPTALDRNYAWNIQVEITDKLSTSTQDLLLSVGIPIFRIGTDGKIYNNEIEIIPKDIPETKLKAYNRCKVGRSTDWAYTTAGWKAIPMTLEFYDTNNMHDNSTNNTRITIQQSGYYRFGANVRVDVTNIGGIKISRYNSAGVLQTGGAMNFQNSNKDISNISGEHYLNAGDYLVCLVYNGVNANVTGTNAGEPEGSVQFWCAMENV